MVLPKYYVKTSHTHFQLSCVALGVLDQETSGVHCVQLAMPDITDSKWSWTEHGDRSSTGRSSKARISDDITSNSNVNIEHEQNISDLMDYTCASQLETIAVTPTESLSSAHHFGSDPLGSAKSSESEIQSAADLPSKMLDATITSTTIAGCCKTEATLSSVASGDASSKSAYSDSSVQTTSSDNESYLTDGSSGDHVAGLGDNSTMAEKRDNGPAS